MEPISIQIINDKSILDFLQSFLVPLIAIITTFIVYKQWKIEQDKLTHDLFEKRFKVYRQFQIYKSYIIQTGTCSLEQYELFISNTSESIFIFGEDITILKRNLEEKGMELWAIDEELKSDKWSKDEKSKKIYRRLELKKWFLHNKIENVFSKYMKLNQ